MGLITGLLTLPLAPVRGVAWVAERLYEQAQHEMSDPAVVRGELVQLEEAHDRGELSDEEYDERAGELIRRMLRAEPGRSEEVGRSGQEWS